MNRGELLERIKFYVPKYNKNDDSLLNTLIQEAADDIAWRLILLPTSKKFNVVADQYEYDINEEADDFLVIDKEGLFYNTGTQVAPTWSKLLPYRNQQMEDEFSDWRDDDSGTPLRFWLKKNKIFVHPTPSAALTEGFWLYYGERPARMTDDGHYPFTGTDTEIAQFSHLGDVILEYCIWKLKYALDRDSEDATATESRYLKMIEAEREMFNRIEPLMP